MSNDHLAFEALTTVGVKELSCGCVIRVKPSGVIVHERVCHAAHLIYMDIATKAILRCEKAINHPALYSHFSNGVLT